MYSALPRLAASRPLEGHATIQPFSNGLLVWLTELHQLLLLYADGRLGTPGAGNDLGGLGEPLAPATQVTLRLQRDQEGLRFWTPLTGLLFLYPQRWQLLLGGS